MSTQMWEALHVIHEPQGQQSNLSMKKSLNSTEVKEDTNIPTHFNEIQEHFTLFGHIIDGTEFKAVLVASLPQLWEGFMNQQLP